jgi:site-specific recombinase XerD
MNLMPAITAYVTTRRALGADFTTAAKILRSFGRTLGNVRVETINGKQCEDFCWGRQRRRFAWEKYSTLNMFFHYLVGRGHLAVAPLSDPPRRVPSTFRPYIYCHEELRRLLEETAILGSTKRWHMHPETLRTLLLLLYGAGLRVGEALSLRCCDVNLVERLLSIWDTKFFKSRLVPIGGQLSRVLAEYLSLRETLPFPEVERSSLFVFRTGKPLSYASVRYAFAHLRRRAAVRRPTGDHRQPRIHDLRATFAVHRLTAWYREGANVQARLPLLATYLGHSSVAGTVCYLSMTPVLLSEAALRFQRYALPPKENDND